MTKEHDPESGAAPRPSRRRRGGDEHPDLSSDDCAAARAAAVLKRERAQQSEPAISAAVAHAVGVNGGQLARFPSRIKTEDSLYRKVQHIMIQTDTDAITASEWVRDALRYTAVVAEDGYWAIGTRIGEALRHAGYRRSNTAAGWNRQGYRGRNDTFIGSDGLEFEVQIHTAASLKAAENTHRLYEEERLTTTSDERKAQLRKMLSAAFDVVPVPDDVRWID